MQKLRDITVESVGTLNEDDLYELKYHVRSCLTGSRKHVKKIQAESSKFSGEEYVRAHTTLAHQEALLEACLCREDEIYGQGVLSTYDHSQSF